MTTPVTKEIVLSKLNDLQASINAQKAAQAAALTAAVAAKQAVYDQDMSAIATAIGNLTV